MTPQVVRYSERPELWDSIGDLSSEVWPEYNVHGDVLNQYWDQLYETFPEWQFVLYDAGAGQVLAEGHTIPVAWDGADAALDPGIDASLEAGFALRAAGGTPTALCALAATVADWESWTRMRFPETGDYVFPAGLATVHIDRDQDAARYWEPNVWLIHRSRNPA
jgi:hypothetical protein